MRIVEITQSFFNNNSTILTQLFVHGFILCLILFFINKATKKIKKKIQQDTTNSNLLHLLLAVTKIIKFISILLIVTSFLQSNGYSLTSLMTGLGITGLAVGFAANQTISSVFGSISVMTDKVYKLGDYIVIDGYEGIVETVNFHSTKIRTVDNILITIPNNIMANSIVQNKSDAKTLKLIETFDIEYGTSDEDIEKAISLLNGICENMNSIQSGYQTLISKLAESSITLLLIADTTTPNRIEFLKIKNNIYKEALKQFRANGINFAFPSRTVYVQNNDEN